LLKDGSRLQIRSRNDKDLTRMYPTIAAAAQRLKADSAVIDGEIVALGPDGKPSFQALQHRGSNPGHQIVFYAFDVLHLNGRDVMNEPLMKRRARLTGIIGDNQTIRLSQVLPCREGCTRGRTLISRLTKVMRPPVLSMTFGTAWKAPGRAHFRPMEAILTITWLASATCVFALIGILWNHAERTDEAS